MFPGLEEILMAVIENIGLDPNKGDESKEERLEKTLQALFGDLYEVYTPIRPAGYKLKELHEIAELSRSEKFRGKLIKKGKKSRSAAIKLIVGRRHPPIKGGTGIEKAAKKAQQDKFINADFERIKKAMDRDKAYYYWTDPSLPDFETEENKLSRAQNTKNILEALVKAGWPI